VLIRQIALFSVQQSLFLYDELFIKNARLKPFFIQKSVYAITFLVSA